MYNLSPQDPSWQTRATHTWVKVMMGDAVTIYFNSTIYRHQKQDTIRQREMWAWFNPEIILYCLHFVNVIIINTHVCGYGISLLFSRVHQTVVFLPWRTYYLLWLLWAFEDYGFVNVIKRVIKKPCFLSPIPSHYCTSTYAFTVLRTFTMAQRRTSELNVTQT